MPLAQNLRRGILTAILFAVIAMPARAAEPLTEDQMDRVTAGRVEATAQAYAMAIGREARTSTATEAIVSRQTLRSFRLWRIKNSLTIPFRQRDRVVEYGYASAEAKAVGKETTVDCQADLRFSLPIVAQETRRRTLFRPGRAECMCARFGYSFLPD